MTEKNRMGCTLEIVNPMSVPGRVTTSSRTNKQTKGQCTFTHVDSFKYMEAEHAAFPESEKHIQKAGKIKELT